MTPSLTHPVASDPSTPRTASELADRYRRVRSFTERMCQGMEPEDFVIQSMPDVSPTKWHLAHTTWFFEAFVLQPSWPEYEPFHAEYSYLFNSYYNTVGEQFCRPRRGQLSRPTVREVMEYRRHVDEHMLAFIARAEAAGQVDDILEVVTLGTHHEQQHQELMVTDIKHVFSMNPLRPAWRNEGDRARAGSRGLGSPTAGEPAPPLHWFSFEGGVHEIGYDGDAFHFDNEAPRHKVYLEPFEMSSRLVTNGEYLAFMQDRGYERPELWLSMGWAKVREAQTKENDWERFDKPLYWFRQGDEWWQYTLSGAEPISMDEPVVHVSYYEADAYARWAGARLPTEPEWEVASAAGPADDGVFADDFTFHPRALSPEAEPGRLHQMFGHVWEWTSSPYTAYPGFKPWAGAAGEYNGKFMANQLVLRGGSCATTRDHLRSTYRNFFYAGDRWQFMGFRLARDSE